MFALIFVLIAIHSVKNTAIDLYSIAKGQAPPSHVRQMARMAAGTNRRPARPRGTMGSFFGNAYNDAWETANDWRDRKAQVAARNRKAKWAAEDAEFAKQVPAPVNPVPETKPAEVPTPQKTDPKTATAPADGEQTPVSEPAKTGGDGSVAPSVAPLIFGELAASVVEKTDTPVVDENDHAEVAYQRYAMRIRNGGKPKTAEQIQAELGVSRDEADQLATSWDARYKNEHASTEELKATYGRETAEAVRLSEAGRHDEAKVHVNRAADAARKMGITSEGELVSLFQETQAAEKSQPTQNAEQSKNTAEQAPSPVAETQKEVPAVTTTTNAAPANGAANAETIGLQAGLVFLAGMRDQCKAGVANTEISANSLAAGKVGPGVTGPMAQAMEILGHAAEMFEAARAKLEESIKVAEAYEAAPDAGDKEFLTQR